MRICYEQQANMLATNGMHADRIDKICAVSSARLSLPGFARKALRDLSAKRNQDRRLPLGSGSSDFRCPFAMSFEPKIAEVDSCLLVLFYFRIFSYSVGSEFVRLKNHFQSQKCFFLCFSGCWVLCFQISPTAI